MRHRPRAPRQRAEREQGHAAARDQQRFPARVEDRRQRRRQQHDHARDERDRRRHRDGDRHHERADERAGFGDAKLDLEAEQAREPRENGFVFDVFDLRGRDRESMHSRHVHDKGSKSTATDRGGRCANYISISRNRARG